MNYNTSNFQNEIQTRLDAVSAGTPYEELAYLAKIKSLQATVPGRALLQIKTYTNSVAVASTPENCNMIKIWATAKGGTATNYGSGAGGGSINGYELDIIPGSDLVIVHGTSHAINNINVNEPLPSSIYYGQYGGTVLINGINDLVEGAYNGGNGYFSRSGYASLSTGRTVTLSSGLIFTEGDKGSSSTEYGGGASGRSNGIDGDLQAGPLQYGAGAGMGTYYNDCGLQSDIRIEFYEVIL
ncbi:MAG TPA: hypothetical protein EYN67_15065 [Flavobacteriales bacterium]|nr:hypothetical protein [Flavobacteriales bacterium]